MAAAAMSFEKALARLEDINAKLSTGEVSLDEGMKLFEEGLKLSAFCRGKLEEARKRIENAESIQQDKESNG